MKLRATLLLIAAAACRSEKLPPSAKPPAPKPPAPQSCLDRELAARGLNSFGDPPDTAYPGGTPLFNEATGKSTDRAAYIFARHPEIGLACQGRD